MSDQEAISSILRVDKLTKKFPGVVANDEVSLDVKRNEIHCLLGENGAGKTTLAECLYGSYQPDSGKIYFRGEEIHLLSPRDAIHLGIGMVHQHFELVPPMTAIENIVVGTESKGMRLNLKPVIAKVGAICDQYGIELDLGATVSQLPVGKQQWVEILKTMYVGVEFLILDEPTAVLTPQEIEKFFTILTRMKKSGLSIIFITHKLNEVMEISDRVTVLRKGKLINTVNTSDTTKEELARMMVGRDVVFLVKREKLKPGRPVLEIREVHTRGDGQQEALKGVSLCIREYEILGLAGVAGNGQRALFDIVVGMQKSVAGRIVLDGEDVTNLSPGEMIKKGLASIPQDRLTEGLLMDFSISENIILGSQWKSPFRSSAFFQPKEIDMFARRKIADFDIMTSSPSQKVSFLSGGNLQKVILARELSQNPKCLVASQPTRGLDVGAIEYVHQCLLDMRKAGGAILLISEELDEIFNLSDYIAVIFKGQIMGVLDTNEASLQKVGLLMAGITNGAS